jgi:hypothetical protein
VNSELQVRQVTRKCLERVKGNSCELEAFLRLDKRNPRWVSFYKFVNNDYETYRELTRQLRSLCSFTSLWENLQVCYSQVSPPLLQLFGYSRREVWTRKPHLLPAVSKERMLRVKNFNIPSVGTIALGREGVIPETRLTETQFPVYLALWGSPHVPGLGTHHLKMKKSLLISILLRNCRGGWIPVQPLPGVPVELVEGGDPSE